MTDLFLPIAAILAGVALGILASVPVAALILVTPRRRQ